MTKTSIERQRRAAERLAAALTDGHPNVAERAVDMVVEAAAGPYYRPYAITFADVDVLTMEQFNSEYRTEVGQARLRELVEEEFLPSSQDLSKRIIQDPRWSIVLVDAIRALLRNKLLEFESDPDLTPRGDRKADRRQTLLTDPPQT